MRRRDFIAGLGMTAMGIQVARAQQSGMPVVGFLSARSPNEAAVHTNAFRRGLEEMGYVEGRDVTVEYRWASGDYSRLQSLAADLASQPLSLLVAGGDPAAHAAKATGFEAPLVFVVGQDPVHAGLVTSMNRPGKATGVNFFTGDLGGKRLELLCAMVPSARVVGLLLNPRFGTERAEQHRQEQGDAQQDRQHRRAVDPVPDDYRRCLPHLTRHPLSPGGPERSSPGLAAALRFVDHHRDCRAP